MNKQVQRLVLAIALMGIPSINMATNKFTPETRDVNHGGRHYIFSNQLMEGSYNEESQEVEVIFKKEISNVEITIYKEDAICEIAQEKKVTKEDYKSYLLATYGAGEYTICIKVNGIIIVKESVYCNE